MTILEPSIAVASLPPRVVIGVVAIRCPLSLTGRVFSNEQLVNPSWEPVSLRGLGRRRGRLPRWPSIDEAVALFAVSLLLNFYVAPSWLRYGLLPLLAGVEILLIAGPAVVFAYLGNYPWREVFSLRRPSFSSMVGAIFLGLGLIPLAGALVWLQNKTNILPYQSSGMEDMFDPILKAHPWLAPIVIGLLAGVCEELLFRGPIQAALLKRMPAWVALIVPALLTLPGPLIPIPATPRVVIMPPARLMTLPPARR